MKEFDAIVIGGGPAGMTAALYLLRSYMRVALVEKLAPGGQVLLTERIDNYPGMPDGALGYELGELFEKHMGNWAKDNLTRYNDEVLSLEPGQGMHTVVVGDETIRAKAVIITAGAQYRHLHVPGEEEFIGRGISYCALCDGNFFRDKEVAVIGGGNSALEEALYLTRVVKKIHLIHRREDFRGAKCYQDECFMHPKIETLRSTVVKEIRGDKTGVTNLLLENIKEQSEFELPVDGVFIFIGFKPGSDFFREVVKCDKLGFIMTDQEMTTNVTGIFAAGDIRAKNTRQVVTACGDGATAANAALNHIQGHVR